MNRQTNKKNKINTSSTGYKSVPWWCLSQEQQTHSFSIKLTIIEMWTDELIWWQHGFHVRALEGYDSPNTLCTLSGAG